MIRAIRNLFSMKASHVIMIIAVIGMAMGFGIQSTPFFIKAVVFMVCMGLIIVAILLETPWLAHLRNDDPQSGLLPYSD